VIRVWDVLGGGKQLHAVRAHAKLITALAVDGAGTRLLSASLDGLLKVHTLGTLALAHTQRFGGALLSLALPHDNSRLAVGGADGAVTVRARMARLGDALLERREAEMLRGGGYRFFLRGRGAGQAAPAAEGGEGGGGSGRALRPHDRLLRAFDHGGALAAALATRSPATIAALLRELLARGALRGALAGARGVSGGSVSGGALEAAGASPSLEPLLAFAVRHLPHPRYAALCADVLGAVADVFAPLLESSGGGGGGGGALSALLEGHFARVAAAVGGELDTQRQLLGLQGQLDALMAAASGGARLEERPA
jgi:U3 small nucleolar RNA-associated protein 15